MKIAAVVALGSLAVAPAFAVKPCEELKTEIAAKLDAKGVKNYQLGILPTADIKDQTVIGSCEGGAKKITYTRDQAADKGGAPNTAKAAAAPKAQ